MKTPFDNIYVLTLPSFKDRFAFVHKQLNDLDIKHQFMWGTDFGNINTDAQGKEIQYPNLWDYEEESTGRDFSCTINHYNAVYQAYEFGFEKILIMEDDICLIKNKKLIESVFNSIPEDADFVTYDPRFAWINDINQFENDLKNCNGNYIKYVGQYNFMFGGLMYALMNRKTMELYLNNQRTNLFMSDNVTGLFRAIDCNKINKYISSKCLCTDQFNIKNNFKKYWEGRLMCYMNNYISFYNLTLNDFYSPDNYNEFLRFNINTYLQKYNLKL